MATRIIIVLCLMITAGATMAQVKLTTTDIMYIRQKLQISTDTSLYFNTITDTITAASTHKEVPTAKSVWDLVDSLGGGGTGLDTSGYNLNFRISGDTLYMRDGDGELFADLAPYLDNTDTSGYNLNFRISGDTLYVRDGDGELFVSLAAYTPDDWGAQVVETDGTLVGTGIFGDPLSWNGAYVDGPLTGNGLNATPLDILNDGITQQYIADSAVTSLQIRDTTIVTADIKDAAVTGPKIASNAIDSTKIVNGGVSVLDLGQHGASSGQALKWNGTQWAPAADSGVTGSGSAGQVTVWDSPTTITGYNSLFWDAANARLGINTTTPEKQLHILTTGSAGGIRIESDGTLDQDPGGNEWAATVTGPFIQRGWVNLDAFSNAGALPEGQAIIFKLQTDGYSAYQPLSLYKNTAIFSATSNFYITNNANGRFVFTVPAAYDHNFQNNMLITGSAFTTADTATRLRVIGRTQTSSTWSQKLYDGNAQISLSVRDDRRVGILTETPSRALEVAGEVRITDLTTDAATGIIGTDNDGDLSRLKLGSNLSISNDTLHAAGSAGVTDHGALTGLSDDDHSQYALLAGRSGGQSLTGGTASAENLTLNSTAHATKGAVLIGTDNSKTVVGASVYFRGDIAPSGLSADTDDWNPAGLDTASTMRIYATDTVNLTGLQGGSDGRVLYVYNIGEFPITFKTNTTSTSAYRFYFDADIELKYNQGIILQYDATASKWRAAGSTTWARSSVSYEYTTSQSNTALTVPTGTKSVYILCVGAGGGGGGGRRGIAGSIRSGGGGGASGGISFGTWSMTSLSNPATLYINMSAGGAGGSAATTDDTDGGNGGIGSSTDVRTSTSSGDRFISASVGNAGVGGDSDGSSGGAVGAGSMFANSAGGGTSATGAGGTSSGTSSFCSGGGGGGGISTGNSSSSGGNSGASCMSMYSAVTGGAGGASGSNGSSGTLNPAREYGQGGSGGGSGSAGTGGNGGTGIRGGGGGGGGASVNGNNSGAGGAGGPGYVKIIFSF